MALLNVVISCASKVFELIHGIDFLAVGKKWLLICCWGFVVPAKIGVSESQKTCRQIV